MESLVDWVMMKGKSRKNIDEDGGSGRKDCTRVGLRFVERMLDLEVG